MSKHSDHGATWNATRLRVLKRDGYVCAYCGKALIGDDATADHIISRKAGGPSEDWNLIASCRTCNSQKGDRELIRRNFWNTRWLDCLR